MLDRPKSLKPKPKTQSAIIDDPDFLLVTPEPDEWSRQFCHSPVLPRETLLALQVKPDGRYVDLTLGSGGHSRLILSRLGPKGRLLAIDKDPEALAFAALWGKNDPRLILKRASFDKIDEIFKELKWKPADGLLADLGLSSRQLLGSGRGFSWQKNEPLDMRMDPDSELTAFEVVNSWPAEKLLELIRDKAEERSPYRITKTIVAAREKKPIETTGDLSELLKRVIRRSSGHQALNPATKVFMGIRLAVNLEMEALTTLLKKAPACLKPGANLVVISFQSHEDRQVKRAFTSVEGKKIWDNLFKKPITALRSEIEINRRARSAKMRVGRRKISSEKANK
ncbi:MAG: 16S rRNA (cytosine(1402)-N(4))-methyltransferase RsmH [Deltaproteobacteria bacterium]|jgi:16S rRNA (cytosine1402-N4)-methyltransferase|nr:16S rRNA (cytosine(1402)-N(4))-methyltransferase RsmH [Deltaproteobacteria bacterium]